MGSSGWDDGYLNRYPKQQYGHGVPNVLGVGDSNTTTSIYPSLATIEDTNKKKALNSTQTYTPAYGSVADKDLIFQGLSGAAVGGAYYATLSKVRPNSAWGMGAMGKVGVSVILGLSAIGLMRGVDTFGTITSSLGDTLSSMTTRNPYAGLTNQGGIPVLPTDVGSNVSGTRLAAGGMRTVDSTGSTTSGNGAFSLLSIGVGAGLGVGLSYALDSASMAIAKGGVYNEGDSIYLYSRILRSRSNTPLKLPNGELAYKPNWRGLYASVIENRVATEPSLGKNFAPLIMGAVVGGATGGVEGALVGAGLGSYLGSYLLSKEEIGPQLGKRLGAAVVGAVAMSILTRGTKEVEGGAVYSVNNKGTAYRVGVKDKAPYDVYRHPRGYELAGKGAAPSIQLSNEGLSTGSEGYRELFTPNRLDGESLSTKYGLVNIPGGISIPTYKEGYKEVPVSSLPRRDLPTPNALTNPLYASAQVGLFYLPMALLGAYGAAKVYETGVPGTLFKAIGKGTSNYMDKVSYIWPGQLQQKQGAEKAVSGLMKGEGATLAEGVNTLVEGSIQSARGSISSNIKKISLYAIPLSIAANYYMERGISSDRELGMDYSKRATSSHWEGVPIVVPDGKGTDKDKAILNTQRYMAEGSIVRLHDVIVYDSGTVGKGFRDFITSAPDGSMRAALYSMGKQPDLLKAMDRALMPQGAIISGGSPIHFNAWESTLGLLESFTYYSDTLKEEGIGASISAIMSPLSGFINTLAHTVGIASPYAEKGALLAQGVDPNRYRDSLGTVINAGLYGGVGALVGGFLPIKGSKPLGRVAGALVGMGVSLSAKTYTDDTGWSKTGQEIKNTTNSLMAYSDHVRLSGADPVMDTTYMLGGASIAGGIVGLGVGQQFKHSYKGGFIGVGAGILGVVSYSLLTTGSPIPKLSDLGVGGVVTKDKMVSVLTEEKYEPGKDGLTHIHSKALWTMNEVFITTGNTATLWDNAKGDETQFNVGVRVRGEQGKRIASQLNKLHDFLKKVTPGSDLSRLEKETPDLVLGGKGSKSKEKIISFLRETKGDLWISAPYVSMGKETKGMVQEIKNLVASGHNVYMLSQNPDGVMGGGKEELSNAVLSELLAAGVHVYMTPKGSQVLEHGKLLAHEGGSFVTSHNILSANSINKVVEVGIILRGKEYGDVMRDAIKRRILKVGAVELSQRPDINRSIYNKAKDIQVGDGTAFPYLSTTDKGYLMPASMGGSYFYARAQYNALMRQAGLYENVVGNEDASIATSMYQTGYLAKYGSNAEHLPQDVGSAVVSGALVGGLLGGVSGKVGGVVIGAVSGSLLGLGMGMTTSYVTQYDKELTSGGLGAVINEWGARNHLGRLYKEEVGFLPSLTGLVGRVLDRTYLYAMPSGGLWAEKDEDQPINKDAMKYPGEQKGFFETFLSKGTEIVLGAISSVALYLAIGEPLNVIMGEVVKGEVESLINVGASADTFKGKGSGNIIQGIFSRQLTTGRGVASVDIPSYREGLLKEVAISTRADYEELDRAKGAVKYLSEKRVKVINNVPLTLHDPSTDVGKAELRAATEELDRVRGAIGSKGYYSMDRMGFSVYHLDTLMRDRAGRLVEGTLKPFVLEHIDPYLEGSEGASSLRKGLSNIIYEIKRPAMLDVEVTEASTRVISFIKDVRAREEELLLANPKNTNAWQEARDDVLTPLVAYPNIDDDIANVTFKLRNVGRDRASRVASAIQEVLDLIPLPPTQWRAFTKHFGGGVEHSKDIKVLGDIFSFEDVTNAIGRALQGTGGLSEYIQEYKKLPGAKGLELGLIDALTAGPGKFMEHVLSRNAVTKALESISVVSSKMERELYKKGGIRWGDDLSPALRERVEKEVVEELMQKQPSFDPNALINKAYISNTVQDRLGDLADPLVREITTIDNVVLDVLRVHDGPQGTLGARSLAILGETLRARQHSSYMSGVTKRKLDRIRVGWGGDATSGVTKGKFGTAAITALALSLFAERLVRTTDGVSIFSQVSTALSMRAEGIQVSTEFKGDALLPTVAGVPLDYLVAAGLFVPSRYIAHAMQGQRVITYAMRKDTIANALNISRADLDGALSGAIPDHPLVSKLEGGMAEVDIKGTKAVLHLGTGDDFMKFSVVTLEGNRWRNTVAAWAISMVAMTVATKGIAAAMNTSRSATSSGAMDPFILGGVGSIVGGGILARTMGSKGLVGGMVLGAIAGAVIGTATSRQREDREGTLDPIALGLVGLGAGKAIGGKGRMGLAGALVGGAIGMVSGLFTSFLKVGRDDWKDLNRKEATILADMTTFIKRVKDRAREGHASRLELMGAYYAMGWSKALRGTEQEAASRKTQVIAKQAVLPFLQVFMAETIKGTTYNEDGTMRALGTSYYSVGIQGPIVSGISVPIVLPFKVTRGPTGTIGVAMNEQDNVGTFMGDVTAMRTAILTTLTGMSLVTGTVNMVQAGARSALTNTPFMSKVDGSDWSSGARKVIDAITETALILPSTALRITMSMSSVDYIVAGKAFMPKPPSSTTPTSLTSPGLYGRHFGGALVWGVLGAAVGGVLGGVMSSSPTDAVAAQVGSTTGAMIGASVGVGVYSTIAIAKETGAGVRLTSRIRKVGGYLPSTLKKVMGRTGPVLALMATLGTLFTSSTFGVSVGMNKPRSWLGYQEQGNDAFNTRSTKALEGEYFPSWVPLLGYQEPTPAMSGVQDLEAGGWTYQRAMTVGLYATIGTAVMSMYGGMGKSVGDTMGEYLRLVRRPRPAPDSNIMHHVADRFNTWRVSRLEKDIDTILRRGHDIVGDAVEGNLIHLVDASKELHSNKVYRATDILTNNSPEVALALDKIVQKGHGLAVSTKLLPDLLPRRALRGATLLGVIAIGVGAITTSMGADTMNRVYDSLDSGNGLMRSIADTFRLFTGTDRTIDEESVLAKQYVKNGGFISPLTRRKMLKADKDIGQSASSLWKQMSELIVFDAPNAFMGVQLLGGVTLRRGEYGDRATPYLQMQGAGADVSTATYSMAAAFLFNSVGNTQDLHFNMINAMREIQTLTKVGAPITQAHLRRAAIGMLSYTAKAEPLLKTRKYSRPTNEVLSIAGKDPLIALSLSHRQMVTRQMSYQPPESLVSGMVKESMNPSHKGIDNKLMAAILKGGDIIGSAISSLMGGAGLKVHSFTAYALTRQGLQVSETPLSTGEWIEPDPINKDTTGTADMPLLAPVRMLLGIFPAPIAYTVGIVALGTVGMYTAASVGGFFLNREVNAIEEALNKYYSNKWYVPETVNGYLRYPHRVSAVLDPSGTPFSNRPLYSLKEGTHGTMYAINSELMESLYRRDKTAIYTLMESVQEAINSSLTVTSDGLLFGDHMRSKPYLQKVTGKVTTFIGKEARVNALVDEITGPLNAVVEKYFDVLGTTDINFGAVVEANKLLGNRKVPFLALFTKSTLEEIITATNKNINAYSSVFSDEIQSYLESRFSNGVNPYQLEIQMLSKPRYNPISTYQDEIKGIVRQVVESHIGKGGSLTNLDWGRVNTEVEGIQHIVKRALHKLMDVSGPLGRLRSGFGGLATPLSMDVMDTYEKKFPKILDSGQSISSASGAGSNVRLGSSPSGTRPGVGPAMPDAEWRARRAKPSNMRKVMAGGKVITETAFSIFNLFEAMDLWGAYSRAAEAYGEHSTYTTGERKELAQEAGYVGAWSLISAAVMTTVILGGAKIVAGLGMLAGTIGALAAGTATLTFGSAVALVTLGVAAIAGLTYIGLNVLSAFNVPGTTAAKDAVNGWLGGGWLGAIGKGISKGASRAFDWTVNTIASGVDYLGNKTGSGGVAALGGLLGGAALGAGIASLSYVAGSGLVVSAGASVAGALGLTAGMAALVGTSLVIGGVAITSALVMGLWGTLDPKGMQRVWSKVTSTLSSATKNVPMIGEGFLATKRGSWIQAYINPLGGDSPFFVGTAQQAVEWEFQKTLELNTDYSGERVASSIVDPSIYGYSPNAPINSSLRPDSVVDSFISSEIKLRGQLHNQSIIGQYLWRSVLSSSSNKEVILKEERKHIQAAYERVMKVMAPGKVVGTTISIREQVDMAVVATLTSGLAKAIKDGTPKGVALKVTLPPAPPSHIQPPAEAPLKVNTARSTDNGKVVVKQLYSHLNEYFMNVIAQAVPYPGHSSMA